MILALYRTYLRHVRALPHIYLRHFFRIRGADDFRSILRTKSVELRRKKLNRVSKDLQQLRAANQGKSAAFDHILDIAYGRIGKLRWELIEPLLSNPNPPFSPPNSRKENVHLPAYSPELAALLTSGISHTTRPLQKHHLISPPGLPKRSNSNSEDAELMGPLSRRRERNVRWRFFKSEWKKLYPPLQISHHHSADHTNTHTSSYLPVNYGFQSTGTLLELLALAGSPSILPRSLGKQSELQQTRSWPDASPFDGSLPVRWLRRRYQALLRRVPLLVLRSSQDNFKRIYDVQLGGSAITTPRIHSWRLRTTDVEDALWVQDVQSGRRCR